MPLVWFPNLYQTEGHTFKSDYEGRPVTLTCDNISENPKARIVKADGNVVGTFGPDKITGDHVEIHQALDEQFLIATGHVVFTDPDGTAHASKLTFCWKKGQELATAEDAEITIADVIVRARKAVIQSGKWVLSDYFMTNDRARKPLLSVSGREITIWPGKQAELQSSQLNVLGGKLVGFGRKIFGLDPRATGYPLPTPEYRAGKGLGYTWSGGSIIAPNTALQLHSDASPGDIPGYGLQVTKSFLPEEKSRWPITPLSPLGQRFAFGYFENVLVEKPSDEILTLSRPRNSVEFESSFNGAATGRGAQDEVFSTPAMAAWELGGKVGSGGYIADFRATMLDQYRAGYHVRGEAALSYELPAVKLGPGLYNLARIDTGLFQGNTTFGWGRGTESVVFQPIKPITLGIAAFIGGNGGTPEFDIDPLVYQNGISLRADYRLGPRTASYMTRYDSRLGWFDHELKFTQVMGSLEAFVIYRKYPGDTHYGVTLRINGIQDLVERRNPKSSRVVNPVGLP